MGGLSSGKNKKAAKKMKKADFLRLLTAFAASSFHEGASLQGHKGPIPEGLASRSDDWGSMFAQKQNLRNGCSGGLWQG